MRGTCLRKVIPRDPILKRMTEKCHYLWHPNHFPIASRYYKFFLVKQPLNTCFKRGRGGSFWPCHCLRLHVFSKVGFTSVRIHTKLFDLKNSWDISVSSDYSDCVKSLSFSYIPACDKNFKYFALHNTTHLLLTYQSEW